MSNEIWVINASPLILLDKLGHNDLLESLTRRVIVPQAVSQEVAAGASGDAALNCVFRTRFTQRHGEKQGVKGQGG